MFVGALMIAVFACGEPVASTSISQSPDEGSTPGATGALHAFWWFDINWTAEQRPGAEPDIAWEPITSTTLAMGRLDGEPVGELLRPFADPKPFTSFRSLEPFAHRIAREGVVFGYFDGARSLVEWVDPTTGEGDVILVSERPIHNALVSRDRSTLYAVLLDTEARTEAGVWAFDLASGDTLGHLLVPASRFDPETGGLIEELSLTPDDSLLVVRDCYRECRVRVVDLDGGSIRTLAQKLPAGTSAHGVTDSKIVMDANCELPCPLLAVDLHTGMQTSVGWECSTAVVLDTSEGSLVVSDGEPETCLGDLRIVASRVEPLSEPVEIFHADVADAYLVSLGDQFDALLPDHTFLVAAGSSIPVRDQRQGFPLLIDAATEAVRPVPRLRSK
jgi:hypothetical protein